MISGHRASETLRIRATISQAFHSKLFTVTCNVYSANMMMSGQGPEGKGG